MYITNQDIIRIASADSKPARRGVKQRDIEIVLKAAKRVGIAVTHAEIDPVSGAFAVGFAGDNLPHAQKEKDAYAAWKAGHL